MKIFICYNSLNQTEVAQYVYKLKEYKLAIFFDSENILGGQYWEKRITEEIETSEVSLIFIGRNGIGPFQNKEIHFILNWKTKTENGSNNYKIIPIFLFNVKKGEESKYIPLTLFDYQYIKFNKNIEIPINEILRSLNYEINNQSMNFNTPDTNEKRKRISLLSQFYDSIKSSLDIYSILEKLIIFILFFVFPLLYLGHLLDSLMKNPYYLDELGKVYEKAFGI